MLSAPCSLVTSQVTPAFRISAVVCRVTVLTTLFPSTDTDWQGRRGGEGGRSDGEYKTKRRHLFYFEVHASLLSEYIINFVASFPVALGTPSSFGPFHCAHTLFVQFCFHFILLHTSLGGSIIQSEYHDLLLKPSNLTGSFISSL